MFTHINAQQQPQMVDVTAKTAGDRRAVAMAQVQLPAILGSYLQGQELMLKKGPVIQTAIIAGTMAVKKTAELIPFCHPLPLQACNFTVTITDNLCITIECEVKTNYQTGVEMEALTGVSVAALTIYDMCKSVSPNIVIKNTMLVEKRGGKSDLDASQLPLYGLVLTGGYSRRMGQDKALIDYHGRPQGELLYQLLTAHCEQVFLSARPEQWQGTSLAGLPTLVDTGESRGPFSGILTALRTHAQVNWLVLACDLVNVTPSVLEKLIVHFDPQAIATCYRHSGQGFPEALCSIYTPLALNLFERAKLAEIYCPVKILQMANCRLIDPDQGDDIANINSPTDYGSL